MREISRDSNLPALKRKRISTVKDESVDTARVDSTTQKFNDPDHASISAVEPLIRASTIEEATAKRRALSEPDHVEEIDMDKLESSGRTKQCASSSQTIDEPETSSKRANGPVGDVSEKAADAAAARALVAKKRGLGDPSVQSAQEAAATRHAASGTGDCFGASAATRLRRQLEAARATTKASPSVTMGARASLAPLQENAVWLCFPCMQKRGEKSPRVDNDVEKRRCASCSDCPQGIYKLSNTSSAPSQPAGTASGSATSVQPFKARAYAPHLRSAHLNVNLAGYFASRANEPVNLTALDAGGGGDCLFHCVAAIAEKIVFESPSEASRFEPHLRREDFLRGKPYLVSKLRTIVADEIIKQPPEVFLNLIVSCMNQEQTGDWPDDWSPTRELISAGFSFLVNGNANVVEAVGENEDGAPGDMIIQYNNGRNPVPEVLENGGVCLVDLQERIRAIWRTPKNTHWGTVTDAEKLASALRLGLVIFSDVGQRRHQGDESWIYGTAMEDATFDYWGLVYCIGNQHFQVAEASSMHSSTRSAYFRRENLPASILAHYNTCNSSCPVGASILGRVI